MASVSLRQAISSLLCYHLADRESETPGGRINEPAMSRNHGPCLFVSLLLGDLHGFPDHLHVNDPYIPNSSPKLQASHVQLWASHLHTKARGSSDFTFELELMTFPSKLAPSFPPWGRTTICNHLSPNV